MREWFTPFLFLVAALGFVSHTARAAESSGVMATPNALTSSTLLSGADSEALMQKISERMGAVRSFEATFTQEHHLTLFLDVLKAKGVCYFQAPDRFRWEILAPYHSILVFDHDRVAKFEEREGKMNYVESGAYDVIRGLMAQMTGWMRGDFAGDKETFTFRAFDAGREYALEMTPRAKEMKPYIQRIEVYLKKTPLRTSRIVIREPEQDYIEIIFHNVRENAALDPETFNTKKPLELAPPDAKQ